MATDGEILFNGLQECLSSPTADQILNFEYNGDFLEQTTNPLEVTCPANSIPSAAVVTATETNPETQSATVFSGYDQSFPSIFSPYDSDNLSILLNPQPPPDLELDILRPISVEPMAPIYPANQLNQMISPATFTSYSPEPVVANQLPLQPGYLGLEPSALGQYSFLDANGMIGGGELYGDGMGVPTCGEDGDLGFYFGAGMAVRPPEAEEPCGFGIYGPGSIQMAYNPADLQALADGQHLMCSSSPAPLQVPSDISALDDSSYKVGRLSDEERKEKIRKFLTKRNHRNFNKKIKYACRKTLADSRPRVRGRFAKNDEFIEVVAPRPRSADCEYDDDEDISYVMMF